MGDHTKLMPELKDRSQHPFVPRLLNLKIPKGPGVPKIEDYDGEADPVQHVQRHELACLGRSEGDDHTAVLFPSTFGTRAATWFLSLPP